MGRHGYTPMEDQRGEQSIQEEVQRQPQATNLQDIARGVALHKPKCTVRKPVRYGIDETISYALITSNGDPETFEDAMESLDRSHGCRP